MPTARVSTCCRLEAKLLTPEKVTGAVRDDVDEVAIIAKGIEPAPQKTTGSSQQMNQPFSVSLSEATEQPAERSSPERAPRARPAAEPELSSGSPLPGRCSRL